MCDNSYVSQCAPSTCESRSAAATSKYGDTALRKTQIGRKTGEALTLIGGGSLIELKSLLSKTGSKNLRKTEPPYLVKSLV